MTFTLDPRNKRNRRRDPSPALNQRASLDDLSAIRRPLPTAYVVLGGKVSPAHPYGTPLVTTKDGHDAWELLRTIEGARATADAANHRRVFAYLGTIAGRIRIEERDRMRAEWLAEQRGDVLDGVTVDVTEVGQCSAP